MEHIIEEVRMRESIWNTKSPEYRNIVKKENAWDEISTALGKDKKQLKEEWRKLKDSHRQAVNRRKTKSGQGATNRKAWKYEQQMEFLLPTMVHGESDTNIPSPPHALDVQDEEVDDDDNMHDMTATRDQQQVAGQTFREKRRRETKGADKVIQFMAEKEKRKQESRAPDELDLFFASVTQSVRKLPRHVQLKLKREILNVVSLEEEKLELMSANPTLNRPLYVNLDQVSTPSPASTDTSSTSLCCAQSPRDMGDAPTNLQYSSPQPSTFTTFNYSEQGLLNPAQPPWN